MARAHLYKPVQDGMGNLRLGAVVRVLNPGTTTLTSTVLFTADAGTSQVANPVTLADGILNFYTEAATRVRLGITVGSEPEFFVEDIDVLEVVTGGGGFRAGAGTSSVIGGDLNTPATAAGQSALAIGNGSSADGHNDVVVGVSGFTVAGGNSNTLVGTFSTAESPTNTFVSGTTVIGYGATGAGDYGTVVGFAATATGGTESTAVGTSAKADGQDNTALGRSTQAVGYGNTAVGALADAGQAGTPLNKTLALGFGATPTADFHGVAQVNNFEVVPASGAQSTLTLRSPSGARWAITVDDTGHLTTTAL